MLYLDRFDFHKWAAWAWFFLYIVIPLNSVYNLYLYRQQGQKGWADGSASK